MTRNKKKPHLGPWRKRMHRPARLQAAVKWRAAYGSKDIVRGYARWFGVDLICAITDLRMIGVAVDAECEQQVRRTIAARAEARSRRCAEKLAERPKPIPFEWPTDWPLEWILDEQDSKPAATTET